MIKKKSITRYTRQIFAIVEKDISIELRIKYNLIGRLVNPTIQLFLYFFLLGVIFNFNTDFKLGYWDSTNFVLFLLLAYSINFSRSIINKYNISFGRDKYWKTLSAIMVAPVHRFTLLLGTLAAEMIMISVPLIIILVIAYILFPISLFYLFLTLLILFGMFLTFASIGLIIGAFRISHEQYVNIIMYILRFVFLFSCIFYPIYIFPEFIQVIVLINPFYYYFDLLRLTWYMGINYEAASSLITIQHIIIFILITTISPIFSLYLFEKIYKKYGITGY